MSTIINHVANANSYPLAPGDQTANINPTSYPGLGVDYDFFEARIAEALKAAGIGTGGSGITQSQAQAAFTAALNAQNQREFEDFVFQDSTGALVIRRTILNESTGVIATSLLNIDGTAFTGTLTPPLSLPQADSSITSRHERYEATVTGTGFVNGDQLSSFTVYDRAANITTSFWRNDTQLTAIAQPSVTAIVPIADQTEDAISAASSTLTAINNTFGDTTTSASGSGDPSTLMGRIRGIQINEEIQAGVLQNIYSDVQRGQAATNIIATTITSDGSDSYVYTANRAGTMGGWLALDQDYGVDIQIETSIDGSNWLNRNDVLVYDNSGNIHAYNSYVSSVGVPVRWTPIIYPYYRFTCLNNGQPDPVNVAFYATQQPAFDYGFDVRNTLNNLYSATIQQDYSETLTQGSFTVAALSSLNITIVANPNYRTLELDFPTNALNARLYAEITNLNSMPTLVDWHPHSNSHRKVSVIRTLESHYSVLPNRGAFSYTYRFTNPSTSPISVSYRVLGGVPLVSSSQGQFSTFGSELAVAANIGSGTVVLPRSLWQVTPRNMKIVAFRTGTVTSAETVTLQTDVTHTISNDTSATNVSSALPLVTLTFPANATIAAANIEGSTSALLQAFTTFRLQNRSSVSANLRLVFTVEY
jgi:hypothetical protein